MAYYAWSPIKHGADVDKDGNYVRDKLLPAGSTVTQKNLGVSDADWEAMIEAGSIREYEYPDMPDTFQGSPVDFLRQKLADVAGAVEGSGGGYFGPTAEEAMMDPSLVGVNTEESKEEEES
jgi:hypothetical protein